MLKDSSVQSLVPPAAINLRAHVNVFIAFLKRARDRTHKHTNIQTIGGILNSMQDYLPCAKALGKLVTIMQCSVAMQKHLSLTVIFPMLSLYAY